MTEPVSAKFEGRHVEVGEGGREWVYEQEVRWGSRLGKVRYKNKNKKVGWRLCCSVTRRVEHSYQRFRGQCCLEYHNLRIH